MTKEEAFYYAFKRAYSLWWRYRKQWEYWKMIIKIDGSEIIRVHTSTLEFHEKDDWSKVYDISLSEILFDKNFWKCLVWDYEFSRISWIACLWIMAVKDDRLEYLREVVLDIIENDEVK